jgi:tripartite-type tricarboxylate transporter receptor subunit TctC
MIRKLSIFTVLTASLAALAGGVAAQDFPSQQPVRIISAYAAGGSSDLVLRSAAEKMSEVLGQQVIVENKPGAGSRLATEYVARLEPDGYTLLMTGGSALAIAPHLYKDLAYKVSDLKPVSLLYKIPLAMYYDPKQVPVKSLDEFIKYAKEHPGAVEYGSTGRGNAGHLIGEMFEAAAGVDMLDVHYQGSGLMTQDMLAGALPVMTEALVGHMDQVAAGNYSVLGVTSDERLDFAPDVPTFAEQGLPAMTIESWLALFVPAGTPQDRVEILNNAVKVALADPTLKQRLTEQGAILAWSTPEELEARIERDNTKFGEVITKIGLTLE